MPLSASAIRDRIYSKEASGVKKLTGKQVRYLRGLGHRLNPIIMVGREGVSSTLVQSADEALSAHELIKVRVQEGCDLDRHEVASSLATSTDAAVAQVLGKTILLYRPTDKDKKDKIQLP